MSEPTTVLNPLDQLAIGLAGKWKFIMGEPINYSQSFVRMETKAGEDWLHCNYPIAGLDDARKALLVRRALSVLAAEERRLYSLTDAQALAELDALKASQDVQGYKTVP